ncbi:unnamed protein product [Rotaria socialis]|uniref:Uncharacterized protein n=1 Tax=Rotaria socialis TaxID=392032 RepID=A0A818IX49_9BILA|nr:unnamed protein product [Rotaria socialis]CAF3534567.1 unnamed protein product [Rotaria socialis]CAF4543078.1 unnamed protein product [Rotaria socialis]CAF4738428.1 unnamed protein product [Rotaria socialis]CAF4855529.1 unnamed protein product [Rotaria socialis]
MLANYATTNSNGNRHFTSMDGIINYIVFSTCTSLMETLSQIVNKLKNDKNQNEFELLLLLLQQQLLLINGLSTHGADLDIVISSHTPKMTMLTGVGKQISNLRSIPGYYWEFSVGDNSFGGVALLIQHSIKSKVIEKAENFLFLEIQTTNDTAVH